MLCFKFVNNNFMSPSFYPNRINYNNFNNYIELSDFDLGDKEQCAKGIHVIPFIENANLKNIIVSNKIIMLDIKDEDIIYSENNGKMRVKKAFILNEANCDEKLFIRNLISKYPDILYYYIRVMEEKPNDKDRTIISVEPSYAYAYARFVDKKFHYLTKEIAYKEFNYAVLYALYVEKHLSEEIINMIEKERPKMLRSYQKILKEINNALF